MMTTQLAALSVAVTDLETLAPIWDSLVDDEHPGAPFRSYAWSAAWYRHAAPAGEPLILAARSGGRVIGILPLHASRTVLGGVRLRLYGDGTVASDYVGVIARRRDESRAAAAFVRAIAERGFSELFLDGLADDDPLAGALAVGLGAEIETRYPSPSLHLEGDFASYLASRPEGTGSQWQRRRRWLEKRPGFRFERVSSPEELPRAFDTLLDLHGARWQDETLALGEERIIAFHREALAGLAERGMAEIHLLWAEGKPRAALYGFRHGRRFAFYQSGRDPAWQERAVGTVLLGKLIGDAFADGLEEFDFLRGDEAYKMRWANGQRTLIAARAVGRGVRAFADAQVRSAWKRGKAMVKDALPPGTYGRLRGYLR